MKPDRPEAPLAYCELIDAETWAFIDRLNEFYPPEALDWPIGKNREVYDRMSRAFHAGRPEAVTVSDHNIDAGTRAIGLRTYRAGRTDDVAAIVYLHGGGFILGSLDSHDDICADICARTGFVVVSVDYRLAPEHRGTSAVDDALTAYRHVAASYSQPIILIGESAGGNLAAAISHWLRRKRMKPAGQVLIYPSLGGGDDTPSIRLHAEAPLLTARDLAFYRAVRSDDPAALDDPRYVPLADTDFSGLPPTVIFTAECDPLSSDGEIYCDRILAQGGHAEWIDAKGLPHGFLRARHVSKRAAKGFDTIIEAIQRLARGTRAI